MNFLMLDLVKPKLIKVTNVQECDATKA